MKALKYITVIIIMLNTVELFAGVDFGTDLVSRYVWRGMDYGNSASVQPFLSYSIAGFEVGAWASYPLTNDAIGFNENDLYISYSVGPVAFTVTDYYFPEGLKIGDYSKNGSHIIETSASVSIKDFSFMAALNVFGDSDYSFYSEGSYAFYENDGYSLEGVLGIGTNAYVSNTSGNLNVVNIGLMASKDNLSAAYIVNPELETNFLVFGYSIGF